MNKEKRKNMMIEAAFLMVAVLMSALPRYRWISFDFFIHGDWFFNYAESIRGFLFPSAWKIGEIGYASEWIWRTPLDISLGFFGWLGMDTNVSDKFLVFWPIIVLLPVAGYLLVRYVTGSRIGGLAGAAVFSLNTYFLAIDRQGHSLLTLGDAFGLLALLLFIRGVDSNRLRLTAASALVLVMSGGSDFRSAYITVWLIVLYFLFDFFIRRPLDRTRMTERLKHGFLVGGLFLAMNTYWLFPFFLGKVATSSIELGRPLFGGQFWFLANSLTLFYPFWSSEGVKWFEVNPIPVYSWFLPTFAFLGLYLYRKNRHAAFFGTIAIIGILLSKQTMPPFGEVYSFLHKHLPGFNAFRESSKFYYMVAAAYAVLLGFLVSWMAKRRTKGGRRPIYSYLAIAAVFALFLWNIKPVLNGAVGGNYLPKPAPHEDYGIIREVLSLEEGEYRMLWVPNPPAFVWHDDDHRFAGLASLKNGVWKKIIASGGSSVENLTGVLKREDSGRILDDAAVKYIFVHRSDEWLNKTYGSREEYLAVLDSQDYIVRKDIGTHETVVYENEDYHPMVFATNEAGDRIDGSGGSLEVDFENVGVNMKRIVVRGLVGPVDINLSEGYHKGWQMLTGFHGWWDILFGKVVGTPDGDHRQSASELNSFRVDPTWVAENARQGEFTLHPDGSLDARLTVYYHPHLLFLIGGLMSSLTAAGALAYVIFGKRRKASEDT